MKKSLLLIAVLALSTSAFATSLVNAEKVYLSLLNDGVSSACSEENCVVSVKDIDLNTSTLTDTITGERLSISSGLLASSLATSGLSARTVGKLVCMRQEEVIKIDRNKKDEDASDEIERKFKNMTQIQKIYSFRCMAK